MNFTKFKEVHNLDELTYLEEDTLPFLKPDDLEKECRWKSILNEYGLHEERKNDNNIKSYNTSTPSFDAECNAKENHNIVVIGDKFKEISIYYGKKTNRKVYTILCISELEELFKLKHPQSVLIVSEPKNFSNSNIKEIYTIMYNISKNTRLGFITALNDPSLLFFLTKSLTNWTYKQEGGLDIINSNSFIYTDHGIEREGFNESLVKTAIKNRWKNLSIVAHGEGAHANLGSHVLCGIVDLNETTFSGIIPKFGCTKENCKRVIEKGIKTVPAFDLKVESLLFLSCNGFSVSGDLYPTNLSFILSAMEGYMKNCMTTVETVGFRPEMSELIMATFKKGKGLAEVTNILNDLSYFNNNSNQYIYFGDPLLKDENSRLSKISSVIKDSNQHNSIISANKGNVFMRKGERYIAAFSMENEDIEEKLKLEYKDQEYSELIKFTDDLLEKLNTQLLFEMDFENVLERVLLNDKEFKKIFYALKTKTTQIKTRYLSLIKVVNSIYEHRIWDTQEIIQHKAGISQLMREWEQYMAVLLHKQPFMKSIDAVLSSGFSKKSITSSVKCKRCSSRVKRYTLESTGPLKKRTLKECPVCGVLGNYCDQHELQIDMKSNNPDRGETVKVDVSLSNPYLQQGFLVLEVTDKSKGSIVDRKIQKGVLKEMQLQVALPENAGSDLHTVRATWISNLNISFSRQRFVVI